MIDPAPEPRPDDESTYGKGKPTAADDRRPRHVRVREHIAEKWRSAPADIPEWSFKQAWIFPPLLASVVVVAVTVIWTTVDPLSAADAGVVSARFTWAIAAMLLTVIFAFAVGALNT